MFVTRPCEETIESLSNAGIHFVLTGKCSVCGAESTSRCAGCFAVFYCGADCQKRDWRANDHKARCAKPYRVERTPELGREVAHSKTLYSSLRKRTCVISSFRISGCR